MVRLAYSTRMGGFLTHSMIPEDGDHAVAYDVTMTDQRLHEPRFASARRVRK